MTFPPPRALRDSCLKLTRVPLESKCLRFRWDSNGRGLRQGVLDTLSGCPSNFNGRDKCQPRGTKFNSRLWFKKEVSSNRPQLPLQTPHRRVSQRKVDPKKVAFPSVLISLKQLWKSFRILGEAEVLPHRIFLKCAVPKNHEFCRFDYFYRDEAVTLEPKRFEIAAS